MLAWVLNLGFAGGGAAQIIGRRRRTRRYQTPAPFAEPLEESYKQLIETVAASQLRQIVKGHLLAGGKGTPPNIAPPADAIDFDTLAHDAEKVTQFFDLWIEQNDEEEFILLLTEL